MLLIVGIGTFTYRQLQSGFDGLEPQKQATKQNKALGGQLAAKVLQAQNPGDLSRFALARQGYFLCPDFRGG